MLSEEDLDDVDLEKVFNTTKKIFEVIEQSSLTQAEVLFLNSHVTCMIFLTVLPKHNGCFDEKTMLHINHIAEQHKVAVLMTCEGAIKREMEESIK